MRKLFGLAAAMGLVLGAAQPSQAAVMSLTSASLSIIVSSLPAVPVPWNGSGSADVTATDITGLTAGIFSGSTILAVTDPGAFPIAGLAVQNVANGVGNFSGVDTVAGGGLMAVKGTANVCLFAGCAGPPANVTVPFTTAGVNGVGLGGAPIVAAGLVNVTARSNGWTTGTACVTGIPTACQTGSPLSGGHVKLVTTTQISTNIGASALLPMYGILELTFIPEPGTLLLLASGVAGLAMVGRKRMTK